MNSCSEFFSEEAQCSSECERGDVRRRGKKQVKKVRGNNQAVLAPSAVEKQAPVLTFAPPDERDSYHIVSRQKFYFNQFSPRRD